MVIMTALMDVAFDVIDGSFMEGIKHKSPTLE